VAFRLSFPIFIENLGYDPWVRAKIYSTDPRLAIVNFLARRTKAIVWLRKPGVRFRLLSKKQLQ
jgi:hypothetical protein